MTAPTDPAPAPAAPPLPPLAEAWVGFVFFSLLGEWIAATYYLNLASLSLNPSVLLAVAGFAPVVLGAGRADALVRRHAGWLVTVAAGALLAPLAPDPLLRALLVAAGFAALWTVLCQRLLRPDNRRLVHGLVAGLLLLTAARWADFSRNPLHDGGVLMVVAVLLTLGCAHLAQPRGAEAAAPPAHAGDGEPSTQTGASDEPSTGAAALRAMAGRLGIEPPPEEAEPAAEEATRATAAEAAPGLLGLLTAGLALGALLFLTHVFLTAYGVVPRWVGSPPASGLVVPLALGLGLVVSPALRSRLTETWVVGLLGAVLVCFADRTSGLAGGALLALAVPALWLGLGDRLAGRTRIAALVAIAMTTYTALLFGIIFTVVYDYVPGGALFREREEPLILIAWLLLGGLLRRAAAAAEKVSAPVAWPSPARAPLALAVILLGAAHHTRPAVTARVPSGDAIVAMTYNIQQGYDTAGGFGLPGVAEVIRRAGASLVALQESDTVRVSSNNRDVVEWLAGHLGMHAYYGPPTRASTLGVALLSAWPITDARGEVLPSAGELAVLAIGTVQPGAADPITVISAHFGETPGDRMAQAERTAAIVEAADGPVLLLGDFNSEPGSAPIQRLLAAGLTDAYHARHGAHADTVPGHTIDFALVRGMTVSDAEVVHSTASDHAPVTTRVQPR